MADFSSFKQVAIYVEDSKKRFGEFQKEALHDVGKRLKQKIQSMHGVQQAGWKRGLFPPPLLKTGKLKNAVYYRTAKGRVTVDTMEPKLATIHEYGVVMRMTEKQRKFLFANILQDAPKKRGRPRKETGMIVIPPRPTWRVALNGEKDACAELLSKRLDLIFK